MVRVSNGLQRQRSHKKYLKAAKWFRLGRSKVYNQAKDALVKQWQHAYVSRKLKKRDFRKLWTERLSAVLRDKWTKYSVFMWKMWEKNIALDRKMLSNIALAFPEVFTKIYEEVIK
jgi:large subunit ribosomal protein L20